MAVKQSNFVTVERVVYMDEELGRCLREVIQLVMIMCVRGGRGCLCAKARARVCVCVCVCFQ